MIFSFPLKVRKLKMPKGLEVVADMFDALLKLIKPYEDHFAQFDSFKRLCNLLIHHNDDPIKIVTKSKMHFLALCGETKTSKTQAPLSKEDILFFKQLGVEIHDVALTTINH